MRSLGKFFKLIFLGALFVVLSVGYKLFGTNNNEDGERPFGANIANADVPAGEGAPPPEGGCDGGGGDS